MLVINSVLAIIEPEMMAWQLLHEDGFDCVDRLIFCNNACYTNLISPVRVNFPQNEFTLPKNPVQHQPFGSHEVFYL